MDSAHIISADVRVDGTVRGTGSLCVSGAVDGAIDLDGDLRIDAGGQADGTIKGRNVEVDGTVQGDVNAERELVVGATGIIHGDVTTSTLTIHPDASFKGRISMRLDLPSGLKAHGTRRSRR
ncbi:MAG: bactofilin family protein [Myxococcota bacterium]